MLMDRHGTSRVLSRNTRNGVKGFPNASCTPFACRCRPVPDRLSNSPASWAPAKPRKTRARHAYPERIDQEFEG